MQIFFLVLIFCLASATQIFAGSEVPAEPATAVLSRHGGILTVSEHVQILQKNGKSYFNLILPQDAKDLHISVQGHNIAGWQSLPCSYLPAGSVSTLAKQLQEEQSKLRALLATAKARADGLQQISRKLAFSDLAKWEEKLRTDLPALEKEQSELATQLRIIEQQLQHLNSNSGLGQKIKVTLARPLSETTLPVMYSYTFPRCGWRPLYRFEVQPEQEADSLQATLSAEIWQESGQNWHKTAITLADGGTIRQPAPLAEWIIESVQAPRVLNRREASRPKYSAMLAATAGAMPEPEGAAKIAEDTVEIFEEGPAVRWKLLQSGLEEGKTRAVIASQKLTAPLQWLARPENSKGLVWLMARCTLPEGEVWPEGQAEFLIDGQNMGNGQFIPQKGETELFFGNDPRVSIQVIRNSRTKGEQGLIGKERIWQWSWTYKLHNQHKRAINVRVERPEPLAIDEQIAVKWNNSPAAVRDRQKHLLFWEIQVPAGGEATIQHGLSIKAPEKLNINPIAP